MEPISAVGLAAGAVQFADVGSRALLGMIRVLKDLKQTPKRMAELLQDLDMSLQRIYALHNELQQHPSSMFSQLDAVQRQRIADCINTAYQATSSLRVTLDPLFRTQNATSRDWIGRAWRSVVSVTIEKDIEQKVVRIERIKGEVMRELQLANLEVHARTGKLSIRKLELLQTRQNDSNTKLDSLIASNQIIQQESQVSRSQLASIRPEVESVKGSFGQIDDRVTRIDITTGHIASQGQTIRQDLRAFQDEMTRGNRQAIDLIDMTIQPRLLQLENGIAMLPTEVLKSLTSSIPIEPRAKATLKRIDARENAALVAKVERGLMTYPTSLKDACDSAHFANQQIVEDLRSRPKTRRRVCNCRPRMSSWRMRRGRFGVGSSFQAEHDPKCACYSSHKRSWSYSFSVQLLPFLHKAIEFTLASTCGAGGYSFGPLVRYYGVVERSKSPAFRLFDYFPSEFAASKWNGLLDYFSRDNDDMSLWVWDATSAKAGLRTLLRQLRELFDTGQACAAERDEDENTLLHSVIYLIRIMAPISGIVLDQLQQLVELVIDAGVDMSAVSKTHPILLDNHDERTEMLRTGSAFEYAMTSAFAWPETASKMPLLRTIMCLHDMTEATIEGIQKARLTLEQYVHVWHNFHKWPQLADSLEDGELDRAILNRRPSEVSALIGSDGYGANSMTRYEESRRLSPLELAIGWEDGMKMLIDVGFAADPAIFISICVNDITSTRVLIETSNFPGPSRLRKDGCSRRWTEALGLALRSKNQEIQQIVVQGLKTRREALKTLAFEELSEDDILSLGISKDRLLDTCALKVYNMLQSSGVDVPSRLMPGMDRWPSRPSRGAKTFDSVYHFLNVSDLRECLTFAKIIYEFGFTSVDEDNGLGKTPLLNSLDCRTYLRDVSAFCELIHWFIDKGASVTFGYRYFPTIFFYLTSSFTVATGWIEFEPEIHELEPLFHKSATLCSPTDRDDCLCYCSSGGCLFIHMLFKYQPCYRHERYRYKRYCSEGSSVHHYRYGYSALVDFRAMFEAAQRLLDLCGLDVVQLESTYEAFVRQEVFERLGMTHTCCELDGGRRNRRQRCEEERTELRQEDAVLKEQLDLILQAYRNKRLNFDNVLGNFWDDWWEDLDEVLPELNLDERCLHYFPHRQAWCCCPPCADWHKFKEAEITRFNREKIHDRRIETEREALLDLGYQDLDFLEVIRRHFAKDLESPAAAVPEYAAGNSSESDQSQHDPANISIGTRCDFLPSASTSSGKGCQDETASQVETGRIDVSLSPLQQRGAADIVNTVLARRKSI